MRAAAGTRYGTDGFPYVVGLSAVAVGLGLPGLVGTVRAAGRRRALAAGALAIGVAAAAPAALGIRYVRSGKFALRDRVLDAVAWRGDEVVADLGAGAGLLGLGAARRTRGTVHCVDLFIGKDLSGNSPARLRENARLEGVLRRVDIRFEDVRRTTLPDAGVDVVLSSLCLHNVPGPDGRRDALAEVVRLLRPGGTAVISDLAHVDDEYAPFLRAAGLTVELHGRVPGTFPPQRLLVAHAPA